MRWRDFDALPALPNDFFDQARRVHFIGIGGIGMSALAQLLHSRGHHVSGSDAHDSALLDKLREQNITVCIGHDQTNLETLGEPVEAIIWGSAIAPDNPERAAAQKANIPQWHRAQLLAYFVNNAECSIAVSGTHGKSTTSAMIAHILDACGRNPTAILGAEYPPFGSNVRLGDPNLVVVEADESDGSFTLCKPSIAVVTNVEAEHLENYDDSENELWRAFEQFVEQARHAAVLNHEVPKLWDKLDPKNGRTMGFGKTCVIFGRRLNWPNPSFELGAPGQHNYANALAALQAAKLLHVDIEAAMKSLADFHGVARRFERKGEVGGVLVYDDYAHHPTEIESTLSAAKEYLNRPILAIFQPHRYTRTQQMGEELGRALRLADRVIVTQLYSAFEPVIEGISGRIVYDSLRAECPDKPAQYAEDLQQARQIASEWIQAGEAVFTMGAGDVHTLGPQLLQDLHNEK